ncbi:MAG: hypothetical protein LBV54_08290, partial [Puniceicoccales bacterium]|nr:hypothetical protein [Puniceicoccales bacterium]
RAGAFYEVESNGRNVGKIRLVEVDTSLSTAEILSGTTLTLLVKDAIIQLIPAQSQVADAPRPAPTPAPVPVIAAPAVPAPAAPAAEAEIPPPQ